MKKIKISLLICLLIFVGLNLTSQNAFAMDSESCKQCHQDVKKSWETSGHAKMGISCLSCHKSNMKLRQDKKEVCSTCHTTGEIKAGGSIGMPQKEVLEGSKVTFFTERDVPSSHSVSGVTCVDCHMPDNKSHSFKFIMPTSLETDNTNKDSQEEKTDNKEKQVASCTTCHRVLPPKLLKRQIVSKQSTITNMQNKVKKLLETNKEFKDQEIYKKAKANYEFTKKDGSKGIHNSIYIRDILKRTAIQLNNLKTNN
ncbi:cytochrome c3 family protein [Selenihalanaerobacter shriftii]|uniref:Cytochrome c554 and c-prime n=1 Tax=Selenihalanaerobacter shriftii TaxID=142842 RepID=A0A1T4L5F5_9FIRM|nr:ammonia-forming cytochrome c nitrite reductase subunit c552 [Selenihalanaerobacter shriftii]SJZ49740.1 Cytochrome c554 and c-prime [Selenihalanaerobacter shriftii]